MNHGYILDKIMDYHIITVLWLNYESWTIFWSDSKSDLILKEQWITIAKF